MTYLPRCFVCGDEFTEPDWLLRHTDPSSGEDVHERCCPDPACVKDREAPFLGGVT